MCRRRPFVSAHRRGGILSTIFFVSCTVMLFLMTVYLVIGVVVGVAHRIHRGYLDKQENTMQEHVEVESIDDLWNRFTRTKITLSEEEEADHTETDSPAAPEEESAVEETRPDWVDAPTQRVGNVYREVVRSDPFSTVDECYEQLEDRFPAEVQEQLERIVPSDQQDMVDGNSLAGMGISLSFIMKDICRESYVETVTSSVGEMKRVYVLMEFSPAVEHHLQWTWKSYQRQFRIILVAEIAALVLAALAVLYGLLHFDTWTRGYYTQRLLWGVPAAIIAIAAVVLFVS